MKAVCFIICITLYFIQHCLPSAYNGSLYREGTNKHYSRIEGQRNRANLKFISGDLPHLWCHLLSKY